MAATSFELHDEAERELDEAIARIEGGRDEWGLRFLDAVHVAIRTIMDHPEIGRRSGRFRTFVMADWPYTIVYAVEGELIWIASVAHHKRKPGFWRKRKP